MNPNVRDNIELIRRQLSASRALGVGPNFQSQQEVAPLTQIKTGYQAIHERVEQLAKEGVLTLDELDEPLPIAKLEIKDEHLTLLANPTKEGEDGIDDSIDLLGFSEQSLLCFYCIAKELYDEKLFDKALAAFILLTHIAPQASPFWQGLGLVYESQQEWQKANSALQKAIQTNPADFSPFQVLIRIAAQTHDFEQVSQALESHKETPEIKEEVETALQVLPQIMKGGL